MQSVRISTLSILKGYIILVVKITSKSKAEPNMITCITHEHFALVQEPGPQSIGHVLLKTPDSSIISQLIYEYLMRTDSDGPLQWSICQLHGNELPYRCLFERLDIKTSSLIAFSRPVGKALKYCGVQPVRDFQSIPYEDIEDLTKVLIIESDPSTDERYLREIWTALVTGKFLENLSDLDPGLLNHPRFLTTANRVLILYVFTEDPCSELIALVDFLCKAYTQMWFSIKVHNYISDGARNVFKLMHVTRYLSNH